MAAKVIVARVYGTSRWVATVSVGDTDLWGDGDSQRQARQALTAAVAEHQAELAAKAVEAAKPQRRAWAA